VYSATILEHFRHPRRSGELEPADRSGEAHNPLCGDRVRLSLRLSGDRIAEAKFRAEACAICTAAADLLLERIVGMRTADAATFTDDALIVLLNARLRPERRRCATLPLEALQSAIGPEGTDTLPNQEDAQMSNATAKGRFVWYDLMTSNPDNAIPFYQKIVGWGTQKWDGVGNGAYTMWTSGGAPIGGVMQLPPEAAAGGAPPHWLLYVFAPDVDATVKRAQQLGGMVHVPPTDIPTVGRFAVLADPQGAAFAVFAAAQDAPGHEGAPNIGEFSWHELATTDYEAAWNFYHDLFGWEKDSAMDMGPAGMYQLFKRNGVQLGGMYNKPADMPAPPHWLCYAKVDDVQKRVDTIKNLGGQILVGPMEVPGGDWIVVGMDPQGAAFALHSTKA
jgi:predicted enzyme related to lactoylglutathione lyase/NifU-like protein involved in Fe-S cluster formation